MSKTLLPLSASTSQAIPVLSTQAAHSQLTALDLATYARTRNHLGGAVSGLSPFLTHGVMDLPSAALAVSGQAAFNPKHKFIFELGWRAYFQHVWQHLGDAIFTSLRPSILPDSAYTDTLPNDVRLGHTNIPTIDLAVRQLYDTGYIHNHARMWLASYLIHIRKVHWRTGAQWLYAHLLDGDLASNYLSWQWVAGTGSSKPYLFNADNVAQFASPMWHCAGTVLDTTYEAIGIMAAQDGAGLTTEYRLDALGSETALCEPTPLAKPHQTSLGQGNATPLLRLTPESWMHLQLRCAGKQVRLMHAWNLADTAAACENTVYIAVFDAAFHNQHQWNQRRWDLVLNRIKTLAEYILYLEPKDVLLLATLLNHASSVAIVHNQHVAGLMDGLNAALNRPLIITPENKLFNDVPEYCNSFSKWWASTQMILPDTATASASASYPNHFSGDSTEHSSN
jgi:deoxyribodipyrimidine photo-lyase